MLYVAHCCPALLLSQKPHEAPLDQTKTNPVSNQNQTEISGVLHLDTLRCGIPLQYFAVLFTLLHFFAAFCNPLHYSALCGSSVRQTFFKQKIKQKSPLFSVPLMRWRRSDSRCSLVAWRCPLLLWDYNGG
ncbi:hypothetical protein [Pontibacter rugosus]